MTLSLFSRHRPPSVSSVSLDQLAPTFEASTLQYVANFSASLMMAGNQMEGSLETFVACSDRLDKDLRLQKNKKLI